MRCWQDSNLAHESEREKNRTLLASWGFTSWSTYVELNDLSEKVLLEHNLPWGFYGFLLCWVDVPCAFFVRSSFAAVSNTEAFVTWDLLSIVIQFTWICEASNLPCVWSMLYSSSLCPGMHSEVSGKYWKSLRASLLELLGTKVEQVQGNTNVR